MFDSTPDQKSQTFFIVTVHFLEIIHPKVFSHRHQYATMGKDISVTEIREIAIEESEKLFPNGGWDVHHHVFERTSGSLHN